MLFEPLVFENFMAFPVIMAVKKTYGFDESGGTLLLIGGLGGL
jgi:hypothetical protein